MEPGLLEALKVFLISCGWALVCLAGLQVFPKESWALAAYSVFCILGFAWIIPAALVGFKSANQTLKMTIATWAVMGVIAGILAAAFS